MQGGFKESITAPPRVSSIIRSTHRPPIRVSKRWCNAYRRSIGVDRTFLYCANRDSGKLQEATTLDDVSSMCTTPDFLERCSAHFRWCFCLSFRHGCGGICTSVATPAGQDEPLHTRRPPTTQGMMVRDRALGRHNANAGAARVRPASSSST